LVTTLPAPIFIPEAGPKGKYNKLLIPEFCTEIAINANPV